MTDYQTAERMALKERAIPLPELAGKSVLDVGCDHGHWCWLAAERGAKQVYGLDRGRKVKGVLTNLALRNQLHANANGLPCGFHQVDLGRQWNYYGDFDVVLMFSMYHHVFNNCRMHEPIWFWLWQHTSEVLLWENPTGYDDPVVKSLGKMPFYDRDQIKEAAERYFEVEEVGPALHVQTREVWRCVPKALTRVRRVGKVRKGVGGASVAFEYAAGRRMDEINRALGILPLPGSLNVDLDHPFDWDRRFYRTLILDATDRKDLVKPWAPRWARFYPVAVNDVDAFVFRFEGDRYGDNFIELIAETRLADVVNGDRIEFVH